MAPSHILLQFPPVCPLYQNSVSCTPLSPFLALCKHYKEDVHARELHFWVKLQDKQLTLVIPLAPWLVEASLVPLTHLKGTQISPPQQQMLRVQRSLWGSGDKPIDRPSWPGTVAKGIVTLLMASQQRYHMCKNRIGAQGSWCYFWPTFSQSVTFFRFIYLFQS